MSGRDRTVFRQRVMYERHAGEVTSVAMMLQQGVGGTRVSMMTEETEEEYKLGSAVTGMAGRRRDDCPVFYVMVCLVCFLLLVLEV